MHVCNYSRKTPTHIYTSYSEVICHNQTFTESINYRVRGGGGGYSCNCRNKNIKKKPYFFVWSITKIHCDEWDLCQCSSPADLPFSPFFYFFILPLFLFSLYQSKKSFFWNRLRGGMLEGWKRLTWSECLRIELFCLLTERFGLIFMMYRVVYKLQYICCSITWLKEVSRTFQSFNYLLMFEFNQQLHIAYILYENNGFREDFGKPQRIWIRSVLNRRRKI